MAPRSRATKDISYEEYDDIEEQVAVAATPSVSASDAKRDKRRRDIVERVERLRRDAIDRRDNNFHDHITTLHESHLSLLSQPAPTHPLYLLRLHELSVRRDNMLLSAQIQTQRSQELAKRLYDGEVERTEEEYETARRSIKERLLEACQERSRKLREEKDSADLNLESLFDPQPRPHATRRRQPGGAPRNGATLNGPIALPSPDGLPLPNGANGVEPYGFSLLPGSPLLSQFPLASTAPLSANGTPLLQAWNALAANATTGTNMRNANRRKGGGTGPGMPQTGLTSTMKPGVYEQVRRCFQALGPLRGDEIADDLDLVRKKRKRGGDQRGVAAKRAAVAERDL